MTPARQSSLELLERLVAFDTVSARSNLALMQFVADYLEGHGVEAHWSFNAERDKANLLASIGPAVEGGVVLSGHSDVVPVEGQDWSSDPFTVARRGMRLYGRGTADMKSFVAAALALVPELLDRPLARPIHLALTYDEEVGCFGVERLIPDLLAKLPRPGMVIVGEPTSMRIVNAHKGCQVFRTTIRGRPAHSSQPQHGANAILAASELIHFLDRLFARRRAAAGDNPFDPPVTTFNIGRIEGGQAMNIIAERCAFHWEFRQLPEEDGSAIIAAFRAHAEEVVLPRLRATAPEASIVTEQLANVAPLAPAADNPAEDLVRRLTGLNDQAVISFCTEGGAYQKAGLPVVVFGPGSIDQAHQPDEYIELEQIEACEAFLRRLADWASDATAC